MSESPIDSLKSIQRRSKTLLFSKNFWSRMVVRAALVFIAGFLFYQTGRSIFFTQQKLDIYSSAEAEVDNLRLKNLELLLQEERVKSDDFIETDARDRLKYSKENEILFIIPEEFLEDPNLEEYVNALGSYEPLEVSQGALQKESILDLWLEFFRRGV